MALEPLTRFVFVVLLSLPVIYFFSERGTRNNFLPGSLWSVRSDGAVAQEEHQPPPTSEEEAAARAKLKVRRKQHLPRPESVEEAAAKARLKALFSTVASSGEEYVAEGKNRPSIVVAGIGDSGTSATIRALHNLGLVHCPKRCYYVEPPWGHKHRYERVCSLQQAGGGSMTRGAYMRSDRWWETVRFFRMVADRDWECITSKGMVPPPSAKWGFKEPHYAWMLPAMDEAYSNSSKYLIIARDPRDICTNRVQDQFHKYGGCLGISNCYHWWAAFWQRLLDAYENEPRFAVMRIEDLTVPDPTQSQRSMETLRCVIEHIGMAWNEPSKPQHVTTEHAVRELSVFHKHNETYMGYHNGQSEETRRELVSVTSQMTDPPIVHQMMRKLGYDPMDFRLQRAESNAVLCRGS